MSSRSSRNGSKVASQSHCGCVNHFSCDHTFESGCTCPEIHKRDGHIECKNNIDCICGVHSKISNLCKRNFSLGGICFLRSKYINMNMNINKK